MRNPNIRVPLTVICIAALLCINVAADAQLSIGPTGMFVSGNTPISTDRLTLQPSSDLLLTNLTITRSVSPVVNPNNGASSIQSVYTFSEPVTMTGTIGLFFEDGELNGNTASSLALVYLRSADNFYVTATGSNLDLSNKYVSFAMSGIPFKGITAVNNNVSLPISLSVYKATAELDKVKLEWHTTYEQQNSRFEIERSSDGINYTVISVIKAANEISGHRYTSYDYHPQQGVNYYRLVQYDVDGSKKNYGIRKVIMDHAGKVMMIAYPNPTTNKLTISLQNYNGDKIHVALYNLHGSLINAEDIQIQAGRNTYPVNITAVTVKGNYVLKVTGDNGVSRIMKISVQ